MTPKKYSERKREENERATTETTGVVMILVSSFLLLCVFTKSLILGDVGAAVFNILLGFFGYCAYPLLLLCFVFGIVKAKRRVLNFKRKYVVSTIVITVCVAMMAHLATSSAFVDGDYAGYLADVYASKTTVGGLLLGLFVYPVYSIFNFVVSYIFYAMIIAGAILLSSSLITGESSGVAKKHGQRKYRKQVDRFVPNMNFDENGDYQSSLSNGLFVGTIIPPEVKYRSEERSFDEIEQQGEEPERFSSVEDVERHYEKERAKKILFGDRKFDLNDYMPKNQTAPNVESKPKTDTNPDMPAVAMPANKPFEHRFVAGEIINGDEMSAQIRSTIDPLRQYEDKNDGVSVDSSAPAQSSAPSVSECEPTGELYINRSPIINGDFFTEPELPALSESGVSDEIIETTHTVTSEIVKGDEVSYQIEYSDGSEEVKEEIEYRVEYSGATQETIDDATENPVEIEEPIVYEDDEVVSPVEFIAPTDDELIDFTEQEHIAGQMSTDEVALDEIAFEETDLGKEFEKTTTSFKIIDEVEDASERGYANDDDMTGYYGHVDAPVKTTMPVKSAEPAVSFSDSKVSDALVLKEEKSNFEERVSAVSKKVDGEKSQIDIDAFMKSSAEKKAKEDKPKKIKKVKYVRPPIELLTTQSEEPEHNQEELNQKIALLEESLDALGVSAKVESVTTSPAITRYELSMPTGVSVNRIENLAKDIGYYLASNGAIRIESPIPGRRAVGVEVPNDHIYTVSLTEIIKSKEFRDAKSPLSFALGKDLNGKIRVENLEKMPHLLVAGATKSGKSSGLNSMLISMIYKSSPSDVRFILIDPKLVEFTAYNGIPHLMTPTAITDVNQAINAFKWTEKEMDRRYLVLQKSAVRNIQEYNQRPEVLEGVEEKMPYIVVIVDEFASLMLSTKEHAKELDEIIMNIAGKARAAGIHLVLATQRPSVNVITGTVKANLNSRIAFAVSSSQDSRIVLDKNGAESLLGRGDMLFAPVDSPVEIRIQGAYVDNDEVKNIVKFVKENNVCEYDEEFMNALNTKSNGGGGGDVDGVEEIDRDLLKRVCRCLIKSKSASGSLITRRFSVGWNKAAKIMEYVESLGFVGPQVGAKGRDLLIDEKKYEEYFGEPFEN